MRPGFASCNHRPILLLQVAAQLSQNAAAEEGKLCAVSLAVCQELHCEILVGDNRHVRPSGLTPPGIHGHLGSSYPMALG